jgi:hypothetical protein
MAAPENNLNAEKWDIEEAKELFEKALEMSIDKEYDFIGEIARDLNTYRDIFTYLVDKFPELKTLHKRILSNLEANCFSHTKTNKINTAVGIVNLKSNYNWTDRQQTDITTNGKDVNTAPIIKFVDTDEDGD